MKTYYVTVSEEAAKVFEDWKVRLGKVNNNTGADELMKRCGTVEI